MMVSQEYAPYCTREHNLLYCWSWNNTVVNATYIRYFHTEIYIGPMHLKDSK